MILSSSILILLSDMIAEFGFTDRDVDFGRTSDTPTINFVAALDIDKKVIRIPFASFLTSISALIDTYLAITSCREAFKGRPCLRVLNGKFSKQVAGQKQSLFMLGIHIKAICFRVEDSASPQKDLSDVINLISKGSDIEVFEEDMVEFQFSFKGKKIKHQISKKFTIKKLKQHLVSSLPELKTMPIESIQLVSQKNLLTSLDRTVEELKLEHREISIFVLEKEVCFKANTLVMLSNNTYKPICQIKVGDSISTFNRRTRELETGTVSKVSETVVNETTLIKLGNGVQIETTSNNLLLTGDDRFKLVKSKGPKECCLEEGQNLKLFNGKIIDISSIQTKLVLPEVFYHISTQSSKNLVINHGIVSHYQFVKVKSPDGLVQCVDVTPLDTFLEVKHKLEKIYHLNSAYLRLKCFGTTLKDEETILDRNVSNESVLYLSMLPVDKVNMLHPDTQLLVAETTTIRAHQLKENDEIISIDATKLVCSPEKVKVKHVLKADVSEYIAIHLGQKILKVCPETYLLLENGHAILAADYYHQYSSKVQRHWPQLQSLDNLRMPVQKIEWVKQKAKFVRLDVGSSSFVASTAIVLNSVVTTILTTKERGYMSICLSLPNDTTMGQLKKRIQKQVQVSLQEMSTVCRGKQVYEDESLQDLKLQHEQVIVIRQREKMYATSVFINQEESMTIENKIINFHFTSGQKYALQYMPFKEWTIRQILSQYMNTEDPAYFLMFSEVLIFPNEQLSKMETCASFHDPNSTVLVLKNEKLSFFAALFIEPKDIRHSSYLVFDRQDVLSTIPEKSRISLKNSEQLNKSFIMAQTQISKRIEQPQLRKQHFYKPFLYFTSRYYHADIHEYIRKFEEHRGEITQEDSVFAIIKDLYTNMSLLFSHLGFCFYGIRNFRAGMFLKEGNTFYWYNFTLAYKDKAKVAQEVTRHSGTVFRIHSTTGKLISSFSMDPAKQEILFAPHTYFLVDRVIEGKEMDEVWLTEVAAPLTFKKDIILWVDDNPHYNLRSINLILNMKPDLEILQVTTTAAAEKWIKEFGWILNWKGLQFKLISDMGRWELKGNDRVENLQAGIDLLQMMYKTKGYSARTLIFCGNRKRAMQFAEQRKIPQSRYTITESQQDLLRYVGVESQ